tara:strand:- start:208 stop:927 length:720 start_codon:yes stop_codon:yes gene_type:complete
MPKKSDLVNGAYQLIRISGLTSAAVPEETIIGLQVADDLAGELSTTLNTGYVQPAEYGQSDPDDYSGLTNQTAGPFKKLLAMELVDFFGKQVPISLKMNADKGLRSLEQLLVNVLPMQNPGTLPIGSGNEWDYRSDKFYPEPISDDGAIYHNTTDVFQYAIDWSQWLAGANTLVTVEYEADVGIVLTNETIVDAISTVTVSFSTVGQFTLCSKATDSIGNVTSEKVIYNVTDCNNNYYP